MDSLRKGGYQVIKPFLSTEKRKATVAASAVLIAGLLALLCWVLSGGPVHPKIVALVRSSAAGALTGSAPPTVETLKTYRANALKAYLGSFKEPFKQVICVGYDPSHSGMFATLLTAVGPLGKWLSSTP